MPNRLRRRRKRSMTDALISLEQAFQAEAARQERERLVECARIVALQEREAMLQTRPVAWPATMVKEMESHYHELGFDGWEFSDKIQSERSYL
jgi:hypothetical protein